MRKRTASAGSDQCSTSTSIQYQRCISILINVRAQEIATNAIRNLRACYTLRPPPSHTPTGGPQRPLLADAREKKKNVAGAHGVCASLPPTSTTTSPVKDSTRRPSRCRSRRRGWQWQQHPGAQSLNQLGASDIDSEGHQRCGTVPDVNSFRNTEYNPAGSVVDLSSTYTSHVRVCRS